LFYFFIQTLKKIVYWQDGVASITKQDTSMIIAIWTWRAGYMRWWHGLAAMLHFQILKKTNSPTQILQINPIWKKNEFYRINCDNSLSPSPTTYSSGFFLWYLILFPNLFYYLNFSNGMFSNFFPTFFPFLSFSTPSLHNILWRPNI